MSWPVTTGGGGARGTPTRVCVSLAGAATRGVLGNGVLGLLFRPDEQDGAVRQRQLCAAASGCSCVGNFKLKGHRPSL